MAAPLRVLYVHHRPEGGGAPRSLATLIAALGSRVSPVVLTPRGESSRLFEEAGARVITAPAATFTHIWASSYHGLRWALLGREILRAPAHVRALRAALAEHRPHLVHLNDSPLVLAARVVESQGIPVVWHLRSALAADSQRSEVIRGQVQRASVAVAINDDVAESFQLGPTGRVIFNPVELPAAAQPESDPSAKRSIGLEPGIPSVGMLGNLYEAKGWRDLVSAAALVRATGQPIQVALIGEPVRDSSWFETRRGRFLARIAKLENVDAAITAAVRASTMDGAVVRVPYLPDVSTAYRALDVVCMPSRGPEIGRPVLEGQAHAKPVVLTGSRDGGGVVEDVRTGVLARPEDPHALAAAIRDLLANPSRRHDLGKLARQHAERHYAPDEVARRVLAVYRQVSKPISMVKRD